MVIKLEDINPGNRGTLYIGGRGRVASATSVKFLDSRRLVVCSLAGQRLYLMRCEPEHGTSETIHRIPTQYLGEDVCSDLIDFDGRDRIVASNCAHNSATLYRIAGDRLSHLKDIPIPDSGSGFCHGARFVPGAPEMVCLTCVRGERNVYFISTSTGAIHYQFGHGTWRPHDACFLDARRMIVIYQHGKPTKARSRSYGAKAVMVSLDLANRRHEFVDEALFPQGHVDCCQVQGDRAFISNQMRDTVIVCRLLDNRIAFEREVPGYSFPHGLDVSPGGELLAVTNYGDNTIVLTELP